jgi:hypothetical protein
MTFQTFFFIAERTATIRGCTQDQQELIQIRAESFRRADKWIVDNYPGWTTWHTEAPQEYLFTATNFASFAA